MFKLLAKIVPLGITVFSSMAFAENCTTREFQTFAENTISRYSDYYDGKVLEAYVSTGVATQVSRDQRLMIFSSWAILKVKDADSGVTKQIILPMQGTSEQIDLVDGKPVYGACTIDKEFPGSYFSTEKVK